MSALVYAEFVAPRYRDGRADIARMESDVKRFVLDMRACAIANGGDAIEDSSKARPNFDSRAFAMAARFPSLKEALRAALELSALHPDEFSLEVGEWRVPGLRIAVDLLGDADRSDSPWLDPLRLGRALCAAAPPRKILISDRAVSGLRGALPAGAGIESIGTLRLRDLLPRTAVYSLTHRSLSSNEPTLHTLDFIPNNLPYFDNRFVGRTAERREIRLLLMSHRLLSIVGASGLGKTRLALTTAAEIAPEYPAGVWLVELAELDDPDLISEAIAGAMGLKPSGRSDRIQAVIGAIQNRQALILVENCEHLIGRSGKIVQRLLAECSQLRIIATNIQALGVEGEHVYELPALALPPETAIEPDDIAETITLFAARAAERGTPIPSDSETLEQAAALCRLLEGNPLAIELAAARATELEIPELYSRVRERFESLGELEDPSHPRKRSLQAAVDWSINLLSPHGRLLFSRLSVFRGGATPTAVQAIATNEDLPVESIKAAVKELVDKHLLIDQPSDAGERVIMLESLRAHAAGLLHATGTMNEFRARHAEYYRREVAEVAPLLNGPGQLEALRYLRSEQGNIRAALEYLIETHDLESGLKLAATLRRFWATSGFFVEGRRMTSRLLAAGARDRATEGALAAALYSLGSLETRLSDFTAAEEHLLEALDRATRAGDGLVTAKAHNALGRIAWRRGQVEDARAHYETALAYLERSDHPVGIATALNNLALTDLWFGDYSNARQRLEHSLEIAHEVGNQRGIAEALNNLAGIVEIHSDYVKSRSLIAECLAMLQRLEDRRRTPMAISNLAHVALRQGRIQDAVDLCDEALRQQQEFGDASGIALSAIERGLIELDRGANEEAEQHFERGWAMSEEFGESRLSMAARHGLSEVARRRGDLEGARAALDEALSSARGMPDHLETARYLCSLGRLELDHGQTTAAAEALAESLELRRQIGNRRGMAEALEVMARSIDDAELAARMLGAASAGRAEIGAPLPPAEVAGVADAAAKLRTRLDRPAFDREFESGSRQSLFEISAEVLETRSAAPRSRTGRQPR